MNKSWIEEAMELLEDWGTERDRLVMSHEAELDQLDQKIAGAQALVRAYIEKHLIAPLLLEDVEPGHFANKSYPEMLIEIAQERQGYLKVADAVEIMLEANVSGDRRAIQANIYSALRRMRKRFAKMARGEYRYTNHVQKQSDGKPSGLRQAVRELKEKNPQMTKKEALDTLIRNGFDFKGKRPVNAVNITWAYLGYAKKEVRQRSLLDTLPEFGNAL